MKKSIRIHKNWTTEIFKESMLFIWIENDIEIDIEIDRNRQKLERKVFIYVDKN